MSTTYAKTDNYALNLYGDDDPADLRDGYNGSMRTIDATLEGHLNRIEAAESRESNDEEVIKALLGDNSVDTANAVRSKWDKAAGDATAASDKADANTATLTALGADTSEHAVAAKSKWDKAATDATKAIADAAKADSHAATNTGLLAALGADTTIDATASKTKWDKASTDVDALTTRVNYLSGLAEENIVVIGDSISYGTGASDISKSWANRLGAYRSATVTNLAKNDAGYLNGLTPFLQQLKSYSGDKDKVTRILIAGGINDKTHVSDGTTGDSNLTTAVLAVLDYAKANFPHAKIQVIPTICGFTPPSLYNAGVLEARDRIITACGMRRVEVLPYAWEWLNGNSGWSSGDDVHPNDEGNELLLRFICESMDGATVRNSWNGFVAGQDAHGTITQSRFHVEGDTFSCQIQGKAVNGTQAYNNFFQVPAAARQAANYYIPNSLNKLFYLSYQPDIRACAIGTTTAIPDGTEIYLSFSGCMG